MVKLVVRTVMFCPKWLVPQSTIHPCLSVEYGDHVRNKHTLTKMFLCYFRSSYKMVLIMIDFLQRAVPLILYLMQEVSFNV